MKLFGARYGALGNKSSKKKEVKVKNKPKSQVLRKIRFCKTWNFKNLNLKKKSRLPKGDDNEKYELPMVKTSNLRFQNVLVSEIKKCHFWIYNFLFMQPVDAIGVNS